jgi:hypothetical protein
MGRGEVVSIEWLTPITIPLAGTGSPLPTPAFYWLFEFSRGHSAVVWPGEHPPFTACRRLKNPVAFPP